MRRVRQYCEATGTALDDALKALASGTITIPRAKPLINRWNLLQIRLGALSGLTGLALVDALWPAGDSDVLDVRVTAQAIALATPDPKDILNELREAITQPELPGSDSDVIQVMSLHKSKGLTRDLVVIAGCMAGTLPYIDQADAPEIQNAKLEEQRRLFYVAVTRATSVLVISPHDASYSRCSSRWRRSKKANPCWRATIWFDLLHAVSVRTRPGCAGPFMDG